MNCSDAFRARGWIRGAGGDLYCDGLGGANHPHLHIRINGGGAPGDTRGGVIMLAWSDGLQGQGGGGTTFIQNGDPIIANWRGYIITRNMNAGMTAEFTNIMSYFTEG